MDKGVAQDGKQAAAGRGDDHAPAVQIARGHQHDHDVQGSHAELERRERIDKKDAGRKQGGPRKGVGVAKVE